MKRSPQSSWHAESVAIYIFNVPKCVTDNYATYSTLIDMLMKRFPNSFFQSKLTIQGIQFSLVNLFLSLPNVLNY